MRYVLLALITIGLMTYALIDCVRTEDSRIRLGLPHWFWVVAILLLPLAGSITWLIVSRVIAGREGPSAPLSRPERPRPDRPLAPDDDPEFLFRLERDRRRAQQQRAKAVEDAQGEDGPGDVGHPDDADHPDDRDRT